MVTDVTYAAFLGRANEVASLIRDMILDGSRFMVVSHHDADGLSAASIMGAALTRADAQFTIRIVEELRQEILEGILKSNPDVLVFTDIGSGYFDLLSSQLGVKRSFVLDHHPPSSAPPPGIIQLNPHEFGIDGAKLVSAAGVTYFVARALSESNKDLSALAIVGALGDMQDKNEDRSLTGLNQYLVDDGLSSGTVEVNSDLVLYGRETRPIHRALAYTTTPYLPNLSGREDNCLTLLTNNGIRVKEGERFRTLANLSQDEKQRLLNAVISYLGKLGFESSVVLDMVGSVYTLVKEPEASPTRDAREFSALFNACGRTGNPSIGISVGLGDREKALEEANGVVANYRKTLASYMEWLTKSPEAVQKLQVIWVVRGEDRIQESMTGAFSSIISSAGSLSEENAIMVLTRSKDGGFKLSARAPAKLLKKGVNLGAALSSSAKKYSGFGGGHNVAAGAHVKVDDPNEFLKDVDQALVAQMNENVET